MTLILMVCGGVLGGIIGRMINKKIDGKMVEKLFLCAMVFGDLCIEYTQISVCLRRE